MKILWIDLNSSYAHSSLALPALHAQIANDPSIEWAIVSATINENVGTVVDEAYRDYEFSVYIPSSGGSDVSTIFAQWHGIRDRTFV